MNLHEYYNGLEGSTKKETRAKKRNFLDTVLKECVVTEMIARSWIANPTSGAYREPKPIYKPILKNITNTQLVFPIK